MTNSSPPRSSLPEYAHPPIVAATLGVIFRSRLETSLDALRAYQRRLGPEWDGAWSDSDAAAHDWSCDFESNGSGRQLQNVLADRVLRVTPLHFEFTWLGTADGRYPRYENLRDGFLAAWDLWTESQRLSPERIRRWGVSYLNRIPQGTVWQTAEDFSFFKLQPHPPWTERIRSAHWRLSVSELPDNLVIDWTLEDSAPPCVHLRLTATGETSDEPGSILDGMDLGRSAIVQAFSDLISPAANAYWGLRRREK